MDEIQFRELLKDKKKDGRLDKEDVQSLREAFLEDGGMTTWKGDILFELKDFNREHVAQEFDELFIEGIRSLLLEDEVSPGEIDESEAKWLRAHLQKKGYLDDLDKRLLDTLRKCSINCPDILFYKSTGVRRFESVLYFSRFLTILAVVGSMISAIALFVRGSVVVVQGMKEFFGTFTFQDNANYEKLIEVFVSSVDIYLFAMVLIIFGMGIYELFIGKIDPIERKADSRPAWLQISSIDELKSSLGKVILMVLIVSFFKHSIDIRYDSASDLLLLAVGILLISVALFLANKSHMISKKNDLDE